MHRFLDRSLPKWPQMVVTGKPIPIEDAKEVIRRTDDFFGYFSGGNAHNYNLRVQKALQMPMGHSPEFVDIQDFCVAKAKWREEWKYIPTSFVHNEWVSSAYVYGPHGWMHPNGTISYLYNVGKWPSVGEILEDWTAIAAAFPFIDAGVTLMSGEWLDTDKVPVVSIIVKEGRASLTQPGEHIHSAHPPPKPHTDDESHDDILNPEVREIGLPWSWIEEWSLRFKKGSGTDVYSSRRD